MYKQRKAVFAVIAFNTLLVKIWVTSAMRLIRLVAFKWQDFLLKD